jgi:hypothetical protein
LNSLIKAGSEEITLRPQLAFESWIIRYLA